MHLNDISDVNLTRRKYNTLLYMKRSFAKVFKNLATYTAVLKIILLGRSK